MKVVSRRNIAKSECHYKLDNIGMYPKYAVSNVALSMMEELCEKKELVSIRHQAGILNQVEMSPQLRSLRIENRMNMISQI